MFEKLASKFSVYDFLASLIPGLLLLITIYVIGNNFFDIDILNIEFTFLDISIGFIVLVIFGIVSQEIGELFEKYILKKLFQRFIVY